MRGKEKWRERGEIEGKSEVTCRDRSISRCTYVFVTARLSLPPPFSLSLQFFSLSPFSFIFANLFLSPPNNPLISIIYRMGAHFPLRFMRFFKSALQKVSFLHWRALFVTWMQIKYRGKSGGREGRLLFMFKDLLFSIAKTRCTSALLFTKNNNGNCCSRFKSSSDVSCGYYLHVTDMVRSLFAVI